MAYGEYYEDRGRVMGNAAAKLVPLALILILLLNIGLICAVQLMTAYVYPSQDAVMAEYADFTLLDSEEYTLKWSKTTLCSQLIRLDTGDVRLISTEKHFLFERYRLVSDEAVDSAQFETVLYADCETRAVTVRNQQEIVPGEGTTNVSYQLTAGWNIPVKICLWALGMFVLEIALAVVIWKVRKG